MTRTTLIFLLCAFGAGCTSSGSDDPRIKATGDPYFKCRNAAYVRAHLDVCAGILTYPTGASDVVLPGRANWNTSHPSSRHRD